MIAELKKELIGKISATEDENLLMIFKDRFDKRTAHAKGNVTDRLSQGEFDEKL